MKSNKKFVKIAVILLIVIAIAFTVYHFYNNIFKVEGEARLVKMELPAETQMLTSSLDVVKMDKIEWKEALSIKGWVFKQNVKEQKRDVFLVLKSQNNTLIFDIEKDNIKRPDVTSFYHLDGSVVNHGFEVMIPLYLLKENDYQIGFILSDETGKYFTMSPKELILSNGTVDVKNSKAEAAKPKSSQVSVTLKVPTDKIKCGFEKIEVADNFLCIGGWGFIAGVSADNLKTYVLLKKNETVTIYAVDVVNRKDVSNVYKQTGLNEDNSGFATKIPIETLEKGHYQVGLYIEKGNQCGLEYPKFIDINK